MGVPPKHKNLRREGGHNLHPLSENSNFSGKVINSVMLALSFWLEEYSHLKKPKEIFVSFIFYLLTKIPKPLF